MKKRYTEEQIIAALKREQAGVDVKVIARELGVHMQTIYIWKQKYAGMEVSDAKKLKQLEAENSKLKRMLANAMMQIDDMKFLQSKNF